MESCYEKIITILWEMRKDAYPIDDYNIRYCAACGQSVDVKNFAIRFQDDTKDFCQECADFSK